MKRQRFTRSTGEPRTGGLVTAAIAVVAVSLTLAACGSSGNNNSAGSGGSGSPATDAAGASVAANIKAAQNLVAQDEQRPTAIPITTPVGKPIPTGKTVDYISVGLPTTLVEASLTNGAKLLGWKLKILETDGTPQQVLNAWAQILRQKPDGVVYAGFDQSLAQADLLKAQKENIAVVGCCADATATGGINYFIEPDSLQAQMVGPLLAQIAMAQATANKPPDVLVANIPSYTVLTAIQSGFIHEYKTLCPACNVGTLEMPATDIGQNAPTKIVGYLRSHPNVKLVAVTLDALATGLPAALQAAGLGDIKFIGTIPNPGNLPYIASGAEVADIDFDNADVYLAQLDALARKFAGAPLIPPFKEPMWILTKSNLPSATAMVPEVTTTYQQFAKIWGKS